MQKLSVVPRQRMAGKLFSRARKSLRENPARFVRVSFEYFVLTDKYKKTLEFIKKTLLTFLGEHFVQSFWSNYQPSNQA
jgi:hypothetical protein